MSFLEPASDYDEQNRARERDDRQKQPPLYAILDPDRDEPEESMKYEVPLHRTESITAHVFADSPDMALKLALSEHPEFQGDLVVELLDGDEPGRNFERVAFCESCERPIWDGEKYERDEEGICVCSECAEHAPRVEELEKRP